VATAAAAGARRTDSAYPRLLAWSKAPDMLIASYGLGFAPPPRAALTRMPQVTAVGYVRQISVTSSSGTTLLAPEDDRIPGSLWRRKIVAGRLADPGRSDEVNVSFMLAQARHLRPGGTLRVLLEATRGKPVGLEYSIGSVTCALL
jgi:hypothetical protein